MRSRFSLPTLAIILGLIGLGLGAYFLARMPRTLTIAVGPSGGETHRYVEAVALAGFEAKERIRLKVVTTDGAATSARMLEGGQADLAIVRSDFELPASGQTLLVIAKRTIVVLAPIKRNGIQKLTDLKGKRVAVIRLTDPNLPLVRNLLAVAEIGEKDITLSESELADLPDLMGSGRIDAAIAVVVPSSPVVTEIVPKIARRLAGGVRIVPIEEAQTAADRILGLETTEIPAGAFGTGRPAEETDSVAISYRVMARKSMSEDLAGRVAKSLYDLRSRLSRQNPVAFNAEPPDGKTGARIPVHPGAAAYFDGETKTLFERYGEAIVSGMWGLSIVGSGFMGFLSWAGQKRLRAGRTLVEEILHMTLQARTASEEQLDIIERRGDAIVALLVKQRDAAFGSESTLESAGFALEHFRSVVSDARTRLSQE
jgi:TRAP transporter TAXI family solute receptor